MIIFLIYLAGIVEDVIGLTYAVGIICLIATGAGRLILLASVQELGKRNRVVLVHLIKLTGIIAIPTLIVSTLLPNKNTIYAMASVYVAQVVIDTPETKSLIDKSFKLLDAKLDEALSTSKKETK